MANYYMHATKEGEDLAVEGLTAQIAQANLSPDPELPDDGNVIQFRPRTA